MTSTTSGDDRPTRIRDLSEMPAPLRERLTGNPVAPFLTMDEAMRLRDELGSAWDDMDDAKWRATFAEVDRIAMHAAIFDLWREGRLRWRWNPEDRELEYGCDDETAEAER